MKHNPHQHHLKIRLSKRQNPSWPVCWWYA